MCVKLVNFWFCESKRFFKVCVCLIFDEHVTFQVVLWLLLGYTFRLSLTELELLKS